MKKALLRTLALGIN